MEAPESQFVCTVCGECCRGNQKVWLNPADLIRLAEHLGLKGSSELEEKHIITCGPGEHGVRRPRLRFVLTPAGRACRFLINDLDDSGRLWGKCSLHGTPAKPLVCRLAPLSRSIDLDTGTEEWLEVPPVSGCPGWSAGAPPDCGRSVPPPDLEDSLREDLDDETGYFQELAAGLSSECL